jgi:hypothetical protein
VSALIPQHYFDYLRGGSPDPLAGVVRHNQMDLRGLAALFGKIDMLIASGDRGVAEFDSLDLFGLSRFLQKRGDCHRAHVACTQALDLGLPDALRPRARRELALLAKRRNDHEVAAALWHEIASDLTSNREDSIHACEQLTIYYERRLRDYARALEFAQLGLAKFRNVRGNALGSYPTACQLQMERKFLSRIARLEIRQRAALSTEMRQLQHSAIRT